MKVNKKKINVPRAKAVKKSLTEHDKSADISPDHSGGRIKPSPDTDFKQMLENLKPHDHLCLIYESKEEWQQTIVTFISTGLKRGEKCGYIVDINTADEIRSYLQASGVDVAAAESSGQLFILSEAESYTREGFFDLDRMISMLKDETDKAIAEGYPVLRVTGEMTWVLRGSPGSEKVLEYEAKLNRELFPEFPCIAICQYDRWKFDPEIIKGVIMTHPLLIKGGRVYHNFYYVQPEEFLNAKRAEMEVKHWFNNLEREQQTKDSLWQSQEKLKSILRAAPTGIGVVINRVLIDANDRFCEMVGYSREELIGQSSLKIYPSEAEYNLVGEEKYRQIAETGTGSVETMFKRKDGRIINVILSSTPLDSANLDKGVVFTALDITQRRQVEEALMQSEQRYRTLFDTMAQGVVYQDASGLITTANPAAERILGISVDQMTGRTSIDPRWRAIHEDGSDFPGEDHAAMVALRTGKPVNNVLMGVFNPQLNEYRWIIIDAVPQFRHGEKKPYSVYTTFTDITERKTATEALQKSENLYRSLFENILNGFAYCKMLFEDGKPYDFIYLDVNKAFEIQTGLKDVVGKKVSEVIPGITDTDTELLQRYGRVALTGIPDTFEIYVSALDMWFSISVYSPEKEYFVAVFDVINERKKNEQRLINEAVRTRILIEQSSDGIVILDHDGKVYESNLKFAEMLGYSMEEMMELHVWDWDYQWPRETLLEMIRSVDEKGDHFETSHRRKDGSIYDVEISTNGAIYAGQKLIFCVCRDITQRKQAEKALYESEEKYRQLVENAAESIFIAQDGIIKFANRRTAEITGYSVEELLSQSFADFIYQDDCQLVMERHLQRMQGLDVVSTYPFRIVCKSGEIKWVEVNVIRIDWLGKSASLIFGSDITERKQLELERQKIDKLESVGTLAGGIAHDFNNILTGILGNISLAILKLQPESTIVDILKEAEKASLRAKDLTQQLLTFARGGAPIKRLMPVGGLITETVNFALRGSNISCSFSIADDLWQVEIDEGQISQVISNLVINARQAMPMGGNIEVDASNINISTVLHLGKSLPIPAGDYVRISVIDHGIGIPSEYIEKIFDPYFTTKQTGSGLGLATCYSIIRNHDGHIGVKSEVGEGSVFYVYLPASMIKAQAIAGEDVNQTIITTGKVLIMDDENVVKDIAGRMLEHIGFSGISFAADGQEAIKLYNESIASGKPFDIVILDLTIPGGMGGLETIQKLREINPAVRAIVSSGYSDNKALAMFKEHGFNAMVAKPYTLEHLIRALREVQFES